MGDSSDDALFIRLEQAPLAELIDAAGRLRDEGHGRNISYSRKVFIPLTHLCRDVCHYCTFAERPRAGRSAYLSPDEVLAIARAGAAAGCTEALFTLGDKPELRYRAAREALDALGYATTIDYLQAMCALVLRETGLLPHTNPCRPSSPRLGSTMARPSGCRQAADRCAFRPKAGPSLRRSTPRAACLSLCGAAGRRIARQAVHGKDVIRRPPDRVHLQHKAPPRRGRRQRRCTRSPACGSPSIVC